MLDFFDEKYKTEPARRDVQFGINDDPKGAYTTVEGDSENWSAIVNNKAQQNLQFIPVDHNIQIKHEGQDQSMCDGMMYNEDRSWIAFIEIKDKRADWKTKAKQQLESTIKIFSENHDISQYKYRYAYAVNSRHPNFKYSETDSMQNFHSKWKFYLCYQRQIAPK